MTKECAHVVEDEDTRNAEEDPEDDVTAHLQDVEDGAGCTEIWEHLSEKRDEDAERDEE
ncbi:hypothetical protein [Halorussus halophilus]|uniref:hypothetical protein n=1 Tax=Halorussus halophilus TaxID=2650975 RepID=UPI001787CD7E|nr:hypothetical protein [Halorussus halophilus]